MTQLWRLEGRYVALLILERERGREICSILMPSTCTKYPQWFPNHLWEGIVNTRSVEAKPLDRIEKIVSIWGYFKPEILHFGVRLYLTIWKGVGMFEAWSRKHMNRIQFLELFDFIETASKGTTFKKKNNEKGWSSVCWKGPQEASETIWNQSETLSIHPSVYLSLSLSESCLSIVYIYIYICMYGLHWQLVRPIPLGS